jgi:hypothetical protein
MEAAKQEEALEQQSRFILTVLAGIDKLLEEAKQSSIKRYHEL